MRAIRPKRAMSSGIHTANADEAINNFFSDRYTAAHNAATDASNIVSAVVDLINPPTPTHLLLKDILTALTTGLALLGLPEVTDIIKDVEDETKTVANILPASLQQASGVAKAIWLAGTANSQTYQIGELDQELNAIHSKIGDMLTSGLAMIMTDVPSFTNFASSGGFSGNWVTFFSNDTAGLNIAFQTYIVTSATAWTNLLAGGVLNTPSHLLSSRGQASNLIIQSRWERDENDE
ncbi:MAG: hypothetical protein Q9175_001351 [Cornicularia normoerica]